MIFSYLLNMQSHPSWVCGLKPLTKVVGLLNMKSHPSWVCGLKQNESVQKHENVKVTPFVGVWIETSCGWLTYHQFRGHTLRGCVD